MDELHTFTLGTFQTNTYVYSSNNGIFIVDPAFSPPNELNSAPIDNKSVYTVLLTHNHLDHIAGLPLLKEDTPIYIHKIDYDNLTSEYLDRGYNAYGYALFKSDEEFEIFKNKILERKKHMIAVNDNDVIKGEFRVIHTPGHTSGSVCFLKNGLLFTGDTMFSQGYGRYDLESGSYKSLVSSLKKLCTLPNTTKIYPGHGPSSVLGNEKKLYENSGSENTWLI